jgi:1,4-dihydroxy-2-naphthoyl-CoA hydrolase
MDAGSSEFPVGGGRAEEAVALLGGDLTGTLILRLGIEVTEAGPERVVARMPVEGNTQPFGLLHGGATAALCETIGSLGAALVAGPESLPVGIELNVNHIRSVREGFVTATGIPLHSGRRTAVWDMRVHDDDGRLVAVGRLTLALSSPASQG